MKLKQYLIVAGIALVAAILVIAVYVKFFYKHYALSVSAQTSGCPLVCGGTDDTQALTDALATGKPVYLTGQTCAVDSLKMSTGNSIICERGSGLKKVGDPSKFMFDIRGDNVSMSGCTIDGSSMPLTTQHYELIYMSGAKASFDRLTIKNVGVGDDHLNDVFRIWDSDFSLESSVAIEGVRGTVVNFLPAKKMHRLRVLGNTIDGLGNSAIYVGNDGAWGPIDMEIAGNSISHCIDAGHQQSGTGEAGNAIQIWQIQYGSIHSNVLRENRFSGVRLAKTSNVMVWGNLLDGNRETSMYCSELGGYSNHCFDNTILRFSTGISSTNQSQRPPDQLNSPDIIENNYLSDGTMMGISVEGSVASGNILQNVPVGIRIGIGKSYGHVVKNNSCLAPNPNGVPMIACLEINQYIPQGTDIIDANVSKAGSAGSPLLAGNFGMWSKVSNISNAAQAVVTASGGTLPKVGETACLAGVQGMDRTINGRCAKVAAVSGSDFTLDLDTSQMPAYKVPDGGQEPYMQVPWNADSKPKYSYPSTMVLRNMMVPERYLKGLSDGSDFYVGESACQDGAIVPGSGQVHAFKASGLITCN